MPAYNWGLLAWAGLSIAMLFELSPVGETMALVLRSYVGQTGVAVIASWAIATAPLLLEDFSYEKLWHRLRR